MHRWPALLGIAASLAIAAPVSAQDSSNADVLAVVDTFFEGLNTADAVLMNSVVAEGSLVTFVVESDDRPDLRVRTMEQATEGLVDGGNYYEEYWEPTVLVKGPIAVVWAPYLFDVDGKRSHCGIDVFNLLRLEGEWKITAIQYSVDEGCPAGR
ncbi:nuclear transport factor 2 family protein [Qipengyuania sp. 1NDH17]|uniref:Nuclear transport factor 2 family protein n=1 Tax=Qipengyuania polymorpha TaxID=2867234 RepID=A0ABS7IXA5_9SPHN|nr:nuclear transport factor 2 family protein [Qipengyuania polymorpha]MBX7458192.1 nuclear transport factor 2 family protein [Qipengyuania polymorpha]